MTNLHALISTASLWFLAMTGMIDKCPTFIRVPPKARMVLSTPIYTISCHCPPSLWQGKQVLKNKGIKTASTIFAIRSQLFLLPSFRDRTGIFTLSTRKAQRGENTTWVSSFWRISQPALAAERLRTFMKKTSVKEKTSWRNMSSITWPTPQQRRWIAGVPEFEAGSIK